MGSRAGAQAQAVTAAVLFVSSAVTDIRPLFNDSLVKVKYLLGLVLSCDLASSIKTDYNR